MIVISEADVRVMVVAVPPVSVTLPPLLSRESRTSPLSSVALRVWVVSVELTVICVPELRVTLVAPLPTSATVELTVLPLPPAVILMSGSASLPPVCSALIV